MEPLKPGLERRFRGLKGWAPLTDYVVVREDGSYVVRKPDENGYVMETKCDAYSLEYCMKQVELGNWERLQAEVYILATWKNGVGYISFMREGKARFSFNTKDSPDKAIEIYEWMKTEPVEFCPAWVEAMKGCDDIKKFFAKAKDEENRDNSPPGRP